MHCREIYFTICKTEPMWLESTNWWYTNLVQPAISTLDTLLKWWLLASETFLVSIKIIKLFSPSH